MADGSTSLADVEVVTFGCRLNAYESEQAKARAVADGLDNALIFNTCAVTGEAVRQARQAIRKARRERPDAKIVVTGCAAQIDPQAFAGMEEVDLVLGNAEKTQARAYAPGEDRVRAADIMTLRRTGGHLVDGLRERARAYVEVQNGCDHRCTFCIIPFGRGNSRSVPVSEVLDHVRRLVGTGVSEVVLTGVDLTSWGGDLDGKPLGSLVAAILREVPELPRLRLSSIDAAEIDDELMACLAGEERLCPHLHLSLQSGDDMILKRMKRRHSREQALDLIGRARAARPDIAFGADFIAGFPTEDEAMFENTVSFVDEAGLSYLHVFPFSARPGTPAARMPAVAGAIVKDRAARLRAAGDAALVRHLERQAGRTVPVLIEKAGVGRAADFTEIAFAGEAPVGGIVPMTLTGHDGRRAIAG
jgi:threonylcarbamoyladenosine tRNA methylthiotransferase MtaB